MSSSKRNNGFVIPEWQAFVLVAIIAASIGGTMTFNQKYLAAKKEAARLSDTLCLAETNYRLSDSRFDDQKKLCIKNTGQLDIYIDDLYIFYFDHKENCFTSLRGTILEAVRSNGGTCHPEIRANNKVWDGSVLCYFLKVRNERNHYDPDAIGLWLTGKVPEDGIVEIDADGGGYLLPQERMECGSKEH